VFIGTCGSASSNVGSLASVLLGFWEGEVCRREGSL
jgi:hypothetical protein